MTIPATPTDDWRHRAASILRVALALLLFLPAWGATPPPAKPGDLQAQPLTEDGWALFRRVFSLVLRDYVDPKTPEEVVLGALRGAASAAGPESSYIPPSRVKAYGEARRAECTLPFYASKGDDFARVLSPFPGLERAPQAGDFLKSVDGTSTYDLSYAEVQILMAGPPGKAAACVFLKRDAFETYKLTLPYQPLPAPAVIQRPGGAVLLLPSLPASFPAPVQATLKAAKGPAVLVDLTACAQGDPAAAIAAAGMLVGKGVGPVSRGQKGDAHHPLSGAGLLAGHRVKVLTGPRTSRGGEVMARALESAGAILVGEPTLGWAPDSDTFPLENGGMLRLNTAFYLDRDGKAIRERPLEPRAALKREEGEADGVFYDRALAAEPAAAQAPREGAGAAAKDGHGA